MADAPALDPDVGDPDGTITCTCGDVFTGANFAERMATWSTHLDNGCPACVSLVGPREQTP